VAAAGLATLASAPAVSACGNIIPGAALFGGTVIQYQVTAAASHATVQLLGIGVGAPAVLSIGFEATGQASKGPDGGLLEWILPSAHAYGGPGSSTFDYESMTLFVGDNLVLADFGANKQIQVADDQVELNPLLQSLCPAGLLGGPQVCDWVEVRGNTPATVEPAGILSLDDTFVPGGQKGVGLILTAPSTALSGAFVPYQAPGLQLIGDLTENSVVSVDLIDLTVGPEAQIQLLVQLATVDFTDSSAAETVPALSRRGGAVLVLGVLALGLISLSVPGRRLSR
jgi:hypothetical protein